MTDAYTPGPRQTVDRAKHPTLGEGDLVHRNGPAWFRADSGDLVHLKEVSFGGWSKDKGSWRVAVTAGGERVEFDVTNRQRGERHDRVVADVLGPGWLVAAGKRHRFDPDAGGKAVVMDVVRMWVGKSSDLAAKGERRARIPKAHESWFSMQTRSGSFFVYKIEEDAKVEAAPASATPSAKAEEQIGLFT